MLEWDDVLRAPGKGVRILVVDSGVEVAHPHFEERKINSFRVRAGASGKQEVVSCPGNDVLGHGTAVAGVIADHAPGAQIDSIQVLGKDKRGQTKVVLAALDWALGQEGGKNLYDIVNCSFGTREERYILGYKGIVDRAFTNNILLVAASNNFDFRIREYPGSFPSVLSTDFGPDISRMQIARRKGHLVEFVTQGASVRVAWRNGEYRQVTGSSFAAPQLASMAARIRELKPDWNVCQMKSALYEFASEH